MPAEREVRRQVRAALLVRGYVVDGNPAGPGTGRGRSDLTVCAEGLFVALECKAPGQHATPSQIYYLNRVQRAGGVGAVVYSAQEALEIIQEELDARRDR